MLRKIVVLSLGLLPANWANSGNFVAPPLPLPWLVAVALLAGPIVLLAVRRWRLPNTFDPGTAWLRALSDDEFLRQLAYGFRRHGYAVAAPGAQARAHGVGLVLKKAGRTFLVHCLAWNQPRVEEDSVRALLGALKQEHSAGGLVVTCGDFTEAARARASQNNVGLVSAPALLELTQAAAHQRAKKHERQRKEPYFGIPPVEVPECPQCGGPRFEIHANGELGCSSPRCVGGR